jgi:hypothetical protein
MSVRYSPDLSLSLLLLGCSLAAMKFGKRFDDSLPADLAPSALPYAVRPPGGPRGVAGCRIGPALSRCSLRDGRCVRRADMG